MNSNWRNHLNSGVELVHTTSHHLNMVEGVNRSLRMVSGTDEEEDKFNALLYLMMAILLIRRALRLWQKNS